MTQAGFWRQNQQPFNRVMTTGYGQVNRVWYLFPQGDGPRGSFTTFADLKPNLRSRDLILLSGVLREQAITPTNVYDVTVLGAANTPRQATDGGVPTGGGATWMAPTSPTATTPLIEVIRQGWTFSNIAFNPVASSAAIRMTTTGGLNEGGQLSVENCLFIGGGSGQIGIEDNGGSGQVRIVGNQFIVLTGTAIKVLNTGNAVPSHWRILGNIFGQNTNDIVGSWNYATIEGNTFNTPGAGATNKVINTIALSAQGSNNAVVNNYFNDAAAGIISTEGYLGSATDHWMNFGTDAVKFGFA